MEDVARLRATATTAKASKPKIEAKKPATALLKDKEPIKTEHKALKIYIPRITEPINYKIAQQARLKSLHDANRQPIASIDTRHVSVPVIWADDNKPKFAPKINKLTHVAVLPRIEAQPQMVVEGIEKVDAFVPQIEVQSYKPITVETAVSKKDDSVGLSDLQMASRASLNRVEFQPPRSAIDLQMPERLYHSGEEPVVIDAWAELVENDSVTETDFSEDNPGGVNQLVFMNENSDPFVEQAENSVDGTDEITPDLFDTELSDDVMTVIDDEMPSAESPKQQVGVAENLVQEESESELELWADEASQEDANLRVLLIGEMAMLDLIEQDAVESVDDAVRPLSIVELADIESSPPATCPEHAKLALAENAVESIDAEEFVVDVSEDVLLTDPIKLPSEKQQTTEHSLLPTESAKVDQVARLFVTGSKPTSEGSAPYIESPVPACSLEMSALIDNVTLELTKIQEKGSNDIEKEMLSRQNLEHACMDLFEYLDLPYTQEMIEELILQISKKGIPAEPDNVQSDLELEDLSKKGTHEYKMDDSGTDIAGLTNLINQKLNPHELLGRYVVLVAAA